MYNLNKDDNIHKMINKLNVINDRKTRNLYEKDQPMKSHFRRNFMDRHTNRQRKL